MRPFKTKIEFLDVNEVLIPLSAKPALSEGEVEALAHLIDWGGWSSPVVVDGYGRVVSGTAKIEAARLHEYGEVPLVRLEHLSPTDIADFANADARLAARIGWGGDILARDREPLDHLAGVSTEPCTAPDPLRNDVAPPAPAPALVVTEPGDRWRLGRHTLRCERGFRGSALVQGADAVFLSPPDNLYAPLDKEAFVGELAELQVAAMMCLRQGGLAFVAMDWRSQKLWLPMMEKLGFEHRDACVWVGAGGGAAGALYAASYKHIHVFRKGGGFHLNNTALSDTPRGNVWAYPADAGEPHKMPAALIAEAIADATPPGGVVVDLLAGDGATLFAAQQTGRAAFLVETDPALCDTLARRFEQVTGEAPCLAASGESFAAVAEARAAETPYQKQTRHFGDRRRG